VLASSRRARLYALAGSRVLCLLTRNEEGGKGGTKGLDEFLRKRTKKNVERARESQRESGARQAFATGMHGQFALAYADDRPAAPVRCRPPPSLSRFLQPAPCRPSGYSRHRARCACRACGQTTGAL
jgi:hypothetical protein